MPMPRIQPTTQIPSWSRIVTLRHPVHIFFDSGVIWNTRPSWRRLMPFPPTALAMAPTRAPIPQPWEEYTST